ncbi:MAG TPA: MFS transporter, partial [Saprospiraceae bacterium]|nr:MFS transporter [Saprospiraceae bacterium]
IILHGICYDFFFVTGNIYTDQVAGPQVRSSAQGLITLATYGLGMYIGFWAAGAIAGANVILDAGGEVTNHHWDKVWLFPAMFAAGVTVLFLLFFKKSEKQDIA